MTDWVELETISGKKISLRPEYINVIFEKENHTDIYYDDKPIINGETGKLTSMISIGEPYEQVKQKIMDAKKVDRSGVMAEYFTRDEYEMMFEWANAEHYYSKEHNQKLQDSICDKLNKILEEER